MSLILIADDNAQNLYLARFLLEQQGHAIKEAHDGREAVEVAAKHKFELILMDIQMPVMNGFEATKLIKQDKAAPLIIALTAKAMAGDRDEILASGCDGYIEKPIDSQRFVGQVEKYLVGDRSD